MSTIIDSNHNNLLEKDTTSSLDENLKFSFSSSYTDNMPKLLHGLNISLIASSYQAQRIFFIRSDGSKINTHFKVFKRPMGIAVDEESITLGTFDRVIKFIRSDASKEIFEDSEKIDSCFIANAIHITGMINIHDIAYGNEGLYIVNSAFSCISKLTSNYSFEPYWKPDFISELVPEDRCHLNGMALRDGKPRYVTTFNTLDKEGSWKKSKDKSQGTLIDIKNNEILLNNLYMPHSPRYKDGKIYFCESGKGFVYSYDIKTKEKSVLVELNGFTRGIDIYGPLMFVGTSKIRDSNETSILSMENNENTFCGIYVINLENNTIIGEIIFKGDIEQIYDISILSGTSYPELIEPDNENLKKIYNFKQGLK